MAWIARGEGERGERKRERGERRESCLTDIVTLSLAFCEFNEYYFQ